jgi:hypothetical protein
MMLMTNGALEWGASRLLGDIQHEQEGGILRHPSVSHGPRLAIHTNSLNAKQSSTCSSVRALN